MSIATTLLDQARTAGITLRLAEPGRLTLRGDAETVARWLPALKPHRAELLAMLTEVRREWNIREPDGTSWVSTFAPAQTMGEVLSRYASGTQAAPVEDPDTGADLPEDVAELVNGWLDRINETCPQTRAEALQLAKARPSVRDLYRRMARPPTPQKRTEGDQGDTA